MLLHFTWYARERQLPLPFWYGTKCRQIVGVKLKKNETVHSCTVEENCNATSNRLYITSQFRY